MTDRFMNVEVPFQQAGNRRFLTALQMAQEPWLREFVERFPGCFEYSPHLDCVFYYPDGDAPK